jgi:FkbM family methyltransferase
MTFISYAQNQEDVVLWRALKDITNGRYLDIGAQHPILDSVSKAFYERGWRGVHVEPVPEYASLMRQDRPDEVILEVALTSTSGSIPFFVIPDTGLSTGSESIAGKHQSCGFATVKIAVATQTLASVFARMGDNEVHWMKIDVEGMEADVLKGWHGSPARPWLVVVESTMPNSTTATEGEWEQELVNRGYAFALFDGLNRYYVADKHRYLMAKLYAGANPLDQFTTYRQINLELRLHTTEARNRELERRLEATTTLICGEIDQLVSLIGHTRSRLLNAVSDDVRFLNEVSPLVENELRRFDLKLGHATSLLESGFAAPETWGTWTTASSSVISIPFREVNPNTIHAKRNSKLHYRIDVRMPLLISQVLLKHAPVLRILSETEELLYVFFRPGLSEVQEISISVNVTRSPARVFFELTHLSSQLERGTAEDSRDLGFAVTWMDARLHVFSEVGLSSAPVKGSPNRRAKLQVATPEAVKPSRAKKTPDKPRAESVILNKPIGNIAADNIVTAKRRRGARRSA